jgi:hypothetical protein
MVRAVSALPLGWKLFALLLLVLGTLSTLMFIGRYVTTLPWYKSSEGRHLIAMTGSVAAFFLVYVIQLIIPDWSWRPYLMLALLLALVAVCIWRYFLLERYLRNRHLKDRRGTK